MSMSYVNAESALVDDWLEETLKASDALTSQLGDGVDGVAGYRAPRTAHWPFVIYQFQSGVDVGGAGPGHWMVDTVYVVKAIASTHTFTTLVPVAAAITSVLEGAVATFSGGHVTGVRRLSPFQLVEDDQGQEFRHLGGTFRIMAQGD